MRRKTELIVLGGLEVFAIALANWQMLGGVRTDEAKYLLNIPYPHPPFLRWILSLTQSLPFNEIFWRLVFASLMVHAVWLVWDMTRKFAMEDRILICGGWLLSSAFLTQAGSITVTCAMALQTLVFLWLRTRPELCMKIPGWIGLFWLATLFTIYQSILLLPLAWNVLRRAERSRTMAVLLTLTPIALLILYTLSNPLALATMVIRSGQGVGQDLPLMTALTNRLLGFVKLWLIGGGGVASVIGTMGIFRGRDRALQLTFVLVCVYVFFSITPPYYAILFTPFFVAGLWTLFHAHRHPHHWHHLTAEEKRVFSLLVCLIAASGLITWFTQPPRVPGNARVVVEAIGKGRGTGTLLLQGTFGHEWQYEWRGFVRRYKPEFVKSADAIVCLNACTPPFNTTGWKKVEAAPVETWVKK